MEITDELRAEYHKIGVTEEADMRTIHDFLESYAHILFDVYLSLQRDGKLEEFLEEMRKESAAEG